MNALPQRAASSPPGSAASCVAFSLDPTDALARRRQPPRLPGSLQTNRHARCLAAHQCRRHRDGVHRQGRARPGHPHRAAADRGRGARPAARAHHHDLRRHRPHAQRGQTAGSQSVENSGTALRMAGAEVRAILLELAAKRLGVARRHAQASPTASISARRRPQGRLWRACRRGRSQARGDRQGDAEAAGEHIASSASRSRASTSPPR